MTSSSLKETASTFPTSAMKPEPTSTSLPLSFVKTTLSAATASASISLRSTLVIAVCRQGGKAAFIWIDPQSRINGIFVLVMMFARQETEK